MSQRTWFIVHRVEQITRQQEILQKLLYEHGDTWLKRPEGNDSEERQKNTGVVISGFLEELIKLRRMERARSALC